MKNCAAVKNKKTLTKDEKRKKEKEKREKEKGNAKGNELLLVPDEWKLKRRA